MNSACTWWVLARQIVSELSINSTQTHWVNAPLPPVWTVDATNRSTPAESQLVVILRLFTPKESVHLSRGLSVVEPVCTCGPEIPPQIASDSEGSTLIENEEPIPVPGPVTGGEGAFTQWIWVELIESSETICLANTYQVHAEFI